MRIGMVAALGSLLAAGAAAGPAPQPVAGLFVSQADIESARTRSETLPWARDRKQRILGIANGWLQRDDDWIRGILPKPGSKFAYGVAGCPACGKAWKSFGENTASFDHPLRLVCPYCHTVFDLEHPAPPYGDTGDGITINGQTYWLRGVWNAYVVNSMWSAFSPDDCAIVNLGDAYALTGDPRYAHKAAVIMDALATLSPRTRGPRDFSTDPNLVMGRLQHLTSIYFRATIHLARALDLMGRDPIFQQSSPTHPGSTIWDNIHQGLFEDYLFVPFNTRQGKLSTLHNHEADSVRGLIVTGLLFGQPDYVRWGARDLLAFLDNTIDRDGLYYETSLSYTGFTRSVFVEMAELLARYDPAHYPATAKMPSRSEMPLNGDFFNHPRFARLVLESPTRTSVLGRDPTYGNNHWDTFVWQKPGAPFNATLYDEIQRFALYASDPAIRSRAQGIVATHHSDADAASHSAWDLYHAVSASSTTLESPIASRSGFFGQTGVGILRSGEGATRRAAVERIGPNMPHAHNDQGALMLFAKGRALSGDIGYGIFGNHVHLGWATQAIAHNTVVVNQDETSRNRLFRVNPGGDVQAFGTAPGVQWIRTSLAGIFAPSDGVKEYSRLVMQLDLGSEAGYWLDVFDVDGGHVHDYSFHAKPVSTGSFTVEGVDPQPSPGAWTLAGLDPAFKDASFNSPGRAWGERLTAGGTVRRIPGVKDEVPEQLWWYAPPGNGYGFLYNAKSAQAARPWSATWRWKDDKEPYGLRLTMVPDGSQQVITALGPTLTGAERMNWIVARHGSTVSKEAVRTRFAAAIEPFGADPLITSVEPVPSGYRVRTSTTEDTVLFPVAPDGRRGLALVRKRDDKLESLILSGASAVEDSGIRLEFPQPTFTGRISSVNTESGAFHTSPALPACARGGIIVIVGRYSHASTYRVGRVEKNGAIQPADSDIRIARGIVGTTSPSGFESATPLPFANVQNEDTHFFDGKPIYLGKQHGIVKTVVGLKGVKVAGVDAGPGSEYTICDIQAGDRWSFSAQASLTRASDGSWILSSNAPVTVRFPLPVQRLRVGKWLNAGRTMAITAADLDNGGVRFRLARPMAPSEHR